MEHSLLMTDGRSPRSNRPPKELSDLVEAAGAAAREARKAARAIPGVRLIESGASKVERIVLRELKRRMDEAAGPGLPSPSNAPPRSAAAVPPLPTPEQAFANPGAALRSIGDTMQALLRRSMDDTPDVSRRLLHASLMRELIPDEARILSALSDGSTYPMVHVAEPGIGTFQKRLLENASSVGRAAGVALPHRTNIYISHLRRLGLVESGPEDTSVRDEYEILLTEPLVRSVINSIGKGPLQARIIRRTIKISDLGLELWQAAQLDEERKAQATGGSE